MQNIASLLFFVCHTCLLTLRIKGTHTICNRINLSRDEEDKGLIQSVRTIAHILNHDKFMLLEYLVPIVDGCRAAFNIDVEKAQNVHTIVDSDFERYLNPAQQSLSDITICFKTDDTKDMVSLVFQSGAARVYDECVEPDVVINGNRQILIQLLDSDSRISPSETLGVNYSISGTNWSSIVEGLGLLCFPSLLRVARSGIDPSSILSEDADSVIIAAASELVTNLVNRWIGLRVSDDS